MKDNDGRFFFWGGGVFFWGGFFFFRGTPGVFPPPFLRGRACAALGYPVLIAEVCPISQRSPRIRLLAISRKAIPRERPESAGSARPFRRQPHVLFYATKRVGGESAILRQDQHCCVSPSPDCQPSERNGQSVFRRAAPRTHDPVLLLPVAGNVCGARNALKARVGGSWR